jgi:hypothetical protein
MLTNIRISRRKRKIFPHCVLLVRTNLFKSKYVTALFFMLDLYNNKVLQYLYLCMSMITSFLCISGLVTEMSGGNLGRSRSLADIRGLRGSADTISGGTISISGGTISGGLSFYSEAEGLELLSQDSPGDPSQELNALEHVTGLLDYESDGQDQESNSHHPASSSMSVGDPQLQAAMDVKTAGSSQSPAKNVMDSVYYQCRSARILCQKDTLVSVSVDESFGKRVIVQSPSIGSLEDHDGISKTFHGSRVMKGNSTVNKSISSSFDPSKLVCVSCNSEHPVIGNKPSVFCSLIKTLFHL